MHLNEIPFVNFAAEATVIPHSLTATPESLLGEAVAAIQELKSDWLVVVKEAMPVGLLRIEDILSLALLKTNWREVSVAEVMSSYLEFTGEAASRQAFTLQPILQQQPCLPVTDTRGKLAGVVTPLSLAQQPEIQELLDLGTAGEFLQPQVPVTNLETTAEELGKLLVSEEVSVVAVAHADQFPGLITSRDILGLITQERNLRQIKAKQILRKEATLTPETNLKQAYQLLNNSSASALLVFNQKTQLVGSFSPQNLLRVLEPQYLYRQFKTIQQGQQPANGQDKEQLQVVLDAVPGCVSWVSSDLIYLGINQQLAELFQASPEDFVGRPVGSFKSHYEFSEYTRQFFTSSSTRSSVEIQITVDEQPETYLVVAQKYNCNQAAVFVGINITAHRASEAVLLRSSLRSSATNRALLNAIPDLMFRISRDGKFINYKANRDSELFLPPEKFLGKNVGEVFSPQLAVAMLEKINRTLDTEQLQILEYQYEKDGKNSYWEARFAVSDQDEVMAIVRDITRRKETEQKAKQQSQRDQLFAEISLKIRQSLRLEEILKTTVTEVRNILQVDRVLIYQFLSQNIGQTIIEEVKELWPGMGNATFPPEVFSLEYQELYKQSQVQTLSSADFSLTPAMTNFLRQWSVRAMMVVPIVRQEKPWGLIIIHQCSHTREWTEFERDFLEQIALQVSIALEQAQLVTALQEKERRFRGIFNQAFQFTGLLDPDGTLLELNQTALEFSGLQPQEVVGYPLWKMQWWSLSKATRKRLHRSLRQAAQGEFIRYEEEVLGANGKRATIDFSLKPLKDEDDNVVLLILEGRDISDRKEVERELRKSLAKEKELSELKSRFVTMTSHEFRTPLTTIYGSTELLKHYSHKWDEAKKQKYLDRIQKTVQHLTQMLDDILLLGKADSGNLEFRPHHLHLKNFCSALVEEFRLTDGGKHQIIFTAQGEGENAFMDEKLLHHILGNLLSNALKYSPAGQNVEFELFCNQEQATFIIRDYGIGIPSEEQEKLFEPFHRAGNVGQIAGTGLGLVIAQKAIDLHQGSISYTSKVQQGTTFSVLLPLRCEVSHQELSPQET